MNHINLKPKEVVKIEKAIRQDKRIVVNQRAAILWFLHLGQKPEMVADE